MFEGTNILQCVECSNDHGLCTTYTSILIMELLELEKPYDHVKWSLVYGLMRTMGFGPHMSCLVFLLGEDAVYGVMLNGGVTLDIVVVSFLEIHLRLLLEQSGQGIMVM